MLRDSPSAYNAALIINYVKPRIHFLVNFRDLEASVLRLLIAVKSLELQNNLKIRKHTFFSHSFNVQLVLCLDTDHVSCLP